MRLPSLYSLRSERLLPAAFRILGTVPDDLDRTGFQAMVAASIARHIRRHAAEPPAATAVPGGGRAAVAVRKVDEGFIDAHDRLYAAHVIAVICYGSETGFGTSPETKSMRGGPHERAGATPAAVARGAGAMPANAAPRASRSATSLGGWGAGGITAQQFPQSPLAGIAAAIGFHRRRRAHRHRRHARLP